MTDMKGTLSAHQSSSQSFAGNCRLSHIVVQSGQLPTHLLQCIGAAGSTVPFFILYGVILIYMKYETSFMKY